MGDTLKRPPITLFAAATQEPLTLRAAGQEAALTKDERDDLLRQSLAGEPITLSVDIRPFSQRDGQPNRNFTRFRTGALTALGRSGKGTVFLRDHAQREQLARGGTITKSKMVKLDDGAHELQQTVQVVKPWAVQGLLDNTIDRFSIGWHPTGPVLCTACDANIRECWHWPGDIVAQDEGDPKIVEFEFQSAELVETSAVAVPAVKGTGVDDIRAALGLESKPRGERRMPSKKPEQSEPAAVNEDEIRQTATAAEQNRISAILRTGKAFGLSAEFIAEHTGPGSKTTAAEFRQLAEDEYEKAKPSPVSDQGRPSIEMGQTSDSKYHDSLVAAILAKAGQLSKIKRLASGTYAVKGETLNLADTTRAKLAVGDVMPEMRGGVRLFELLKMAEQRKGRQVHGIDQMRVVGRAFRHANTIPEAGHTLGALGYAATGDFTVALEEAIHKLALAGYAIVADTWSRICSVASLSDFRPHNMYRIGEQGTWQKVNEHGEFTTDPLPDARREINQAETFGRIMKITRQTIINDDLNLITRQAQAFGRAGARVPESLFYAELALNAGLGPLMASDGLPLFDAAHANIGASSVLSVAGLEADRVLMEDQQDDNDQDFLTIIPSVLLIGNNQRGQALRLNQAEFDIDPVAPASVNLNRSPNVVQGLFSDIVASPRAKSISADRRWIFADPNDVETFQMGFLDGIREPSIETREGWTVDGTEWKGRLDVGVAAVDFKGAVTNAGT